MSEENERPSNPVLSCCNRCIIEHDIPEATGISLDGAGRGALIIANIFLCKCSIII